MGNLFLPDFSGPFTKQELPVSYRPGRFRAIPKTSQTIMTPMMAPTSIRSRLTNSEFLPR